MKSDAWEKDWICPECDEARMARLERATEEQA